MIPTLTADDILDLPLSTKEKSSTSRNRLGYHVFLSWYFGVFKAQTEEDKRAIVSEFVEDDEDSKAEGLKKEEENLKEEGDEDGSVKSKEIEDELKKNLL